LQQIGGLLIFVLAAGRRAWPLFVRRGMGREEKMVPAPLCRVDAVVFKRSLLLRLAEALGAKSSEEFMPT
jgi:hypothetical protein